MKVKKKRNKGLIIGSLVLVVLILILGATAFFFVQMGKNSENVKVYRAEIEAQTVDAIKKINSDVESATREVVDGVLMDLLEEGDSNGIQNTETEAGIGTGRKPETKGLSQAQKNVVTTELKGKYYGILQQQRGEAIGMLESLIGQGKAEYQSLAASGNKNPTTMGNLMSQYMAKVDVMEGAMDSRFQSTVGKMREQLEMQGINADAIVSEYQAEYSRIKEANRQSFMDKAFAMVKGV